MRRISSTCLISFFFFFNDTATTEIYTLSLHDALPISLDVVRHRIPIKDGHLALVTDDGDKRKRSEEHTSELQSRRDLVCRLLLEKKKKTKKKIQEQHHHNNTQLNNTYAHYNTQLA